LSLRGGSDAVGPHVKNVVNVVLFQSCWLTAVWGAGHGLAWAGPAVVTIFLLVHLGMLRPGEHRTELLYVVGVASAGVLLDSWMYAAGVLTYPAAEAWSLPCAPPYIAALWVAFAMLPRFSLAWLKPRPWLAALLGALGGPLSVYVGTSIGEPPVIAVGEAPAWSWFLVGCEYALVVPVMLRFSGRGRPPE